MRSALLLCALAACGRLGFDPPGSSGDGGVPDGEASDAGDASDAATGSCAGGDGICRVACAIMDPDCVTTCGDGTCVGNIGELCTTCSTDCMTMNPICGNAACDPGESSDTCFADCGPTPWPWAADEDAIVTAINTVRTGGFTCPSSSPATAPALSFAPALLPGAREWAWEYAHHLWTMYDACNGRTALTRGLAAGATGPFAASYVYGPSTSTDAVNFWLADPATCGAIMNSMYTTITVGVARDTAPNGYVLLID